ncbi:MAG: hypothetical protein EA426_09115 [Spirochaetaceae bacterium]|nr:MAG: hypothetical protein EA426_09115 [Spirochaetaceae bacterium]
MTPRERVRTTLSHREPDRVPLDLGGRSTAIEIEAYRDLVEYLGLDSESTCFLRSHAVIDEPVAARLRIDTRWVRWIKTDAWKNENGDSVFVDRWGVPWRKRCGTLYHELDTPPLANAEVHELRSVTFPDLVDDEIAQKTRAQAEQLSEGTEFSVSSDLIGAGVFERAWYLRGFEQFMIDVMCEEEAIHGFLRRIVDHQLAGYDALLSAIGHRIETVWMTDDVATQDSLIVSPEVYRRVVRPYQKELIEFIQSHGVTVVYHSCGAVRPLLPDLIEIGVRVFHPLQTTARGMDPRDLKRDFGSELVFWGGGCDTETLQNGSPADVADEVKERIEILAPGGGFVFCPTHCIQPYTPAENILAMVDTLHAYGVSVS